MWRRIKLFQVELMVIFSFFTGCTASSWLNQSFSPYDFRSYKGNKIELMFTQSLDSILPMSDHLVEVHYRHLESKKLKNWQLAKKVWLDPFNLEDVEVNEGPTSVTIKFPWGNALETINYEEWERSSSSTH